ncbi:MAG: diguanylate cyclase [Thermoleophilia bacterium]
MLHAARTSHATHDPDGATVSRPPRRRHRPALLRGRFRTLFFVALAALALTLGQRVAAAPALLGAALGVLSVSVARRRDGDLAHTFVVLDWLLLGCALALSGGAESWLLGSLPLLAMGQLAGAPRHEWPYLLAPSLLLVIALAIADPDLGGNRAAGLAKVGVLVAGGVAAAARLRRGPARPRRALRVDDVTGFSTGARLHELLEVAMDEALAEHHPLGVACLRLEHYEDSRDFLGAQGTDQLVKGVARRIGRRLGPDDKAFRVRPDTFVLFLPGRSVSAARELADAIGRDVGAGLIGGRRQTLATGASSFPTVRHLEDLLGAARDETLAAPSAGAAAPLALPVAVAR